MYQVILNFWFHELQPKHWFTKDPELDANLAQRFGALVEQARRGELFGWRSQPEGRLAEILLIDQFSRNVYRDRPEAFSADAVALVLAQEAIAQGADQQFKPPRKTFFYMPFMHSESALIHAQAIELFDQPGMENNLHFEHKHKAIIDRFGRYPHRNKILGRHSTADEIAFLKEPGSSF